MTDQPATICMLVHGEPKVGKALAIDTPLPTPSGWKTVGDVCPGDLIIGGDGQPVQVVAITPVWDGRPCFSIRTKDRAELVADSSHVWKTRTGLAETRQLIRAGRKGRCLPPTPVMDLPDVELPVPPYVLGAWLGDGAARDGYIVAHQDDRFILDKCVSQWPTGRVEPVKGREHLLHAHLPGVVRALRLAGAQHTDENRKGFKHLPSIYLRAGVQQRRDLLAGLIDTDGSTGNGVVFTNNDLELVSGVAELARSLGLMAWIKNIRKKGMPNDHYRVTISGANKTTGIVSLPRKVDALPSVPASRHKWRTIQSVNPVESVPVRCIQVDNEDGMFLAGPEMVPTHNSWFAQTTPGPRLVLDAEGGSRYPWRMRNGVEERPKTVVWNPKRDDPPDDDGTWETCWVHVSDFTVIERVFEVLNTGDHPFNTVIWDSLTEIQKKCKDAISGNDSVTERQWGDILIRMEHIIRSYRDLTLSTAIEPLECVLILALSHERDRKIKPAVQGSLSVNLAGYFDVEGYLFVKEEDDGSETRKLRIKYSEVFEAGDRTHVLSKHYGAVIKSPDVEEMLDVLQEAYEEDEAV